MMIVSVAGITSVGVIGFSLFFLCIDLF